MTAEFDEAALVARLERERVLPVVVIERASDAAALADALVAGGCSLIEITLRTGAALDAIAALANHPSIVVGAGTVLNVAQAREAQAAGARFLVAPGFDSATVTHARASGIPMIPGIATATELQRATSDGARIVKFFPASSLGGAAAVRALSSIAPEARFVPTGGISESDLPDYLAVPATLACGGSWLAATELLSTRNFAEVTRRAGAARTIADFCRGRT
jgi:2-dehydro-3-deoxyphosphogluconate aldolase/(4S)-4-hydroxy-2-oxoglutarate aldolase